jgi:TrpR-related protein YerC/YecD
MKKTSKTRALGLPSDIVSLFEALLLLKTPEECESFLKDLCTPAELEALQERWLVAQLLAHEELSYRDVQEVTGTSLMTITRVARFLKHEPYQGYSLLINRIGKRGRSKK